MLLVVMPMSVVPMMAVTVVVPVLVVPVWCAVCRCRRFRGLRGHELRRWLGMMRVQVRVGCRHRQVWLCARRTLYGGDSAVVKSRRGNSSHWQRGEGHHGAGIGVEVGVVVVLGRVVVQARAQDVVRLQVPEPNVLVAART